MQRLLVTAGIGVLLLGALSVALDYQQPSQLLVTGIGMLAALVPMGGLVVVRRIKGSRVGERP